MPTLTIDPIAITPLTPVAPDVGLLTTTDLEGTGIFDILMKTVKLHLAEEYTGGRITGKEYSTVYLGSISAVLQSSVAYLVNNTQVDKLNAEIGLIRQQTVTELTQTDNTIPLGLGFNGDTLVEGLVANQIDLAASQIAKTNKEMTLVDQQIITELAQTDNQIPDGLGNNSSTTITGIMGSQKLHNDAETKLTMQKVATELAQVVDTLPVGISNSPAITAITGLIQKQKDLAQAQIDKTAMEVVLVEQQVVTELAQTSEEIPINLGQNINAVFTDGVIGAQKLQSAAETKLTMQKVATELAQIVDTLPLDISNSTATAVTGLIKNQKDLTVSQINKTTKEVDLVGQQIVTEIAQVSDTLPTNVGKSTNTILQGLMVVQKLNTQAETKLVDQKTATELAQVSDTLLGNVAVAGVVKRQRDLADSQIKKTKGEVLLLGQKTITELSQTCSTIPTRGPIIDLDIINPWLNTGTDGVAPISGTAGVQNALYAAQTNGFLRDAEQKAAKIMVDSWIAQRTTDEGIQANVTNHLHETDIGAVIVKLKSGIGA